MWTDFNKRMNEKIWILPRLRVAYGWYDIINADRSATTVSKPWTDIAVVERYGAYFALQILGSCGALCALTTSGFRSDADYKRVNWFTCRCVMPAQRDGDSKSLVKQATSASAVFLRTTWMLSQERFPALRNSRNARNATNARSGQWHGWNLSRDMVCVKLERCSISLARRVFGPCVACVNLVFLAKGWKPRFSSGVHPPTAMT